MSPEFLDKKQFTTKSDMYSFGIFMYEVFCSDGENPYGDLNAVSIMFQVVNSGLRPDLKNNKFEQTKDETSKMVLSLI